MSSDISSDENDDSIEHLGLSEDMYSSDPVVRARFKVKKPLQIGRNFLDKMNPQKILESLYFDLIVITFWFGIVMYTADIITDVWTGFYYVKSGDSWWAVLTFALILAPGFVRGTYEVLRRPVIYQSTVTSEFKLKASQTTNRNLNFGLDVLPSLQWRMQRHTFCIKCLVNLFYIMVLTFWFPFLPLIQ